MTSTPQPDAPAATRSPVTSGQVTFSRTDPTDVGQRQIYVRVDEAPTRTLRFGESHTEVVTPGSHRLHANNTLFWKRVAFTIEPGEEIEFALINVGEACVIEPSVTCNHCGYCRSHGH